jgi:hypothetical protein
MNEEKKQKERVQKIFFPFPSGTPGVHPRPHPFGCTEVGMREKVDTKNVLIR